MVNKRGFLRIVEATIAILIVISALLLLTNNEITDTKRDLTPMIPPLLDEVARDPYYRERIAMDYDLSLQANEGENVEIIEELNQFLKERISNTALNYTVRVCALEQACVLEPYPVEKPDDIFAKERVISATLDSQESPRKLKLFLWRIQ